MPSAFAVDRVSGCLSCCVQSRSGWREPHLKARYYEPPYFVATIAPCGRGASTAMFDVRPDLTRGTRRAAPSGDATLKSSLTFEKRAVASKVPNEKAGNPVRAASDDAAEATASVSHFA